MEAEANHGKSLLLLLLTSLGLVAFMSDQRRPLLFLPRELPTSGFARPLMRPFFHEVHVRPQIGLVG